MSRVYAAPYQRCAQSWTAALVHSLRAARSADGKRGIGAKAITAIILWVQSSPKPWTKDFTPHQLARRGGVDPTTARRALRVALESGVVVQLSAHQHGGLPEDRNLSAVYRFAETLPTFEQSRPRKAFPRRGENARRPSPRSHPSGVDPVPTPPPTIQVPSHQGPGGLEPLDADGAALSQALQGEGLALDPAGALTTAREVQPSRRQELAQVLAEHGRDLLQLAEAECQRRPRPDGKPGNAKGLLCAWLRRKPGQVLQDARAIAERKAADVQRVQAYGRGAVLPADVMPAWCRLQELRHRRPEGSSPGYLDHLSLEREALCELLPRLERHLGGAVDAVRHGLHQELLGQGLSPDSRLWRRAWSHHWERRVLAAAGLA